MKKFIPILVFVVSLIATLFFIWLFLEMVRWTV